jgi:hypothetical protein
MGGSITSKTSAYIPFQFFDICKPPHPAKIRHQWVGDTVKGEGEYFFVFVINLLSSLNTLSTSLKGLNHISNI